MINRVLKYARYGLVGLGVTAALALSTMAVQPNDSVNWSAANHTAADSVNWSRPSGDPSNSVNWSAVTRTVADSVNWSRPDGDPSNSVNWS
jgi:hypothetical protein